MDNRPIGIFDSGVGGLTVLRHVTRLLPNEEIVYFGDTARVPYGSKTKETVLKYSRQIIRFLLTKDVKAVIIACNTISSNCTGELREIFDIPLIDVVNERVALDCAAKTKNNRIGVIGTERTIQSNAYDHLLKKLIPQVQVFSKACPLFAPLAEEGWTDNEVSALTAAKYLSDLLDYGIDTLVMGCTHYPLLRECIRRQVGDGVQLVDPGEAAAYELLDFLTASGMLATADRPQRCDCYVSDNTNKFNVICRAALGREYSALKVDIESNDY